MDEEPYIARKNYGRVHLRASKATLTDGTPFTLEEGKIILTYDDQTEHATVSGGSGSGKTLSALNQAFEGYFRASHLPDGPERERLKTAGLIIEAKGDFLSKVWSCAQRYGRMDDLKIFGPTHPEVINLFGDPTENALQRANKLLAMAKAFAGGRRAAGQDSDFWDSAARKLFMHVCLLHEYVKNYRDSLEDEEEKKKFAIPPFTFQYLNLMLMDKGRPLNDEALQSYAEHAREAWKNAKLVFERTRNALQRMILVLCRLDHHLFAVAGHADKDGPFGRERDAGRDLTLGEGEREFLVDSHDFAGRPHFRAQNNVDAGEPRKRKDAFFHRRVPRPDFLGHSLFGQRHAGHDLGGNFRQRPPGCLRDEGRRAARPRIDFKHVNGVMPIERLDGELDVHQTADLQLAG